MGFRDALNKGIKKVGEQTKPENLKKVFNNAKEKALEEKSNKDIVVEGALGAAVAIAFGGAILPVLAGAAIEGVVMKQVSKKYTEIKARKNGGQKPGDGVTPEEGPNKDDSRPKDGPQKGPKPQ